LAVGSSFAQGDQASQLWKSLTCLKTSAGGAEIVVARTIRKSSGCMATTPAKTTTTPASRKRMKAMAFRTGDFFLEPGETSGVVGVVVCSFIGFLLFQVKTPPTLNRILPKKDTESCRNCASLFDEQHRRHRAERLRRVLSGDD